TRTHVSFAASERLIKVKDFTCICASDNEGLWVETILCGSSNIASICSVESNRAFQQASIMIEAFRALFGLYRTVHDIDIYSDRTRADGAKHGTTDNSAIKAAICRTDQPKIGDRRAMGGQGRRGRSGGFHSRSLPARAAARGRRK